MPRKLQPIFIPNEASENTNIRKYRAIEKFKSGKKVFQTRTERYESKLDFDLIAYHQIPFDGDIVPEFLDSRKMVENARSDFKKKRTVRRKFSCRAPS